MIDLTAKSLPNTVCVNGRDYSIYTDFRKWMKFEIAVARLRGNEKIDLIYSAFLGQYGIDLLDVKELHWHKFLALIYGVNNSTKLLEVMQVRAYRKNTDKDYDAYEELKQVWRIEPQISEAEQMELDKFNDLFTQR